MQLLQPSPEQSLLGLRAMKAVATAAGPLGPAARQLMEAAQRHILHTAHDIDTLAAITPAELAPGFDDPALRLQLVQGMVVASIADGVPSAAQFAVVREFAAALAVDAPEVNTIHQLAERQMLLFRLDFLRRSHLRRMAEDQYHYHGGLAGVVKGMLGQRGYVTDAAVAAPYLALEQLPPDTLGHTFFRHCRDRGFCFPGEPGGFPEAGIYHDLSHVLGGFDTDPAGEVQVGAFQAGYMRQNPGYMALFVLLTFTAGVNMTPLPQPHSVGILAEDGMAGKFLHALQRGSRVTTDLSDNWDFWPLLPLPLAEARRRLNITP